MTKDELIIEVTNFVTHKEMISKNSDKYKKLWFLKSLHTCRDICEKIRLVNEVKICEYVLINRHHFLNILPVKTNPSFETSTKKIHNIFSHCQLIIHKYKKIEAEF